jgi:hypothetical protein
MSTKNFAGAASEFDPEMRDHIDPFDKVKFFIKLVFRMCLSQIA